MKNQTRRKFLSSTALMATSLPTATLAGTPPTKPLIHHVFFWLKNPSSKDDLAKLIAGLQTLKKIETIRAIHIGIPAKTEPRPVVDSSYSVSEVLFLDDLAGQKTYQDHPIHKKFVADCSPLWEKILVYDSVDV
ncbi:Dabb family protein [Spirosoma endbachense]|uniref:Dabb family protein n=1 Tax=Spirosoma endbachense TaxID=2666025 RepID=A0A6P1W6Y1_9BACT|nr:Dabb family protein [Spirosoma endbachense]QHW00123.1 Dabb family protein [Spirosoma endbachense]